jgi:hypothetical protein
MLDQEAMKRGFEVILSEYPADVQQELRSALMDGFLSAEPGLHQLDPDLIKGGGAAFLWEDVLDLGDMLDAVRSVESGFAPNELAILLVRLFAFWRRLRTVRVSLSEQQFRVLRAIKTGRKTIADIAAMTGIPHDRIQETLNEMRMVEYKAATVPLVDGDDGSLATRF